MSLELVLAPGMTNSASSLSYPYTNELVNSHIKAQVYIHAGAEDVTSFSVLGRYGVFGVDIDFRKSLCIGTHLLGAFGSFTFQNHLWDCRCRLIVYVGTLIYRITLADFNVDKFKVASVSLCKFP